MLKLGKSQANYDELVSLFWDLSASRVASPETGPFRCSLDQPIPSDWPSQTRSLQQCVPHQSPLKLTLSRRPSQTRSTSG